MSWTIDPASVRAYVARNWRLLRAHKRPRCSNQRSISTTWCRYRRLRDEAARG